MKAKKIPFLLALLTTGILLIYAGYELGVKQMKMNLDTGEGFVLWSCSVKIFGFSKSELKENTQFLCFFFLFFYFHKFLPYTFLIDYQRSKWN